MTAWDDAQDNRRAWEAYWAMGGTVGLPGATEARLKPTDAMAQNFQRNARTAGIAVLAVCSAVFALMIFAVLIFVAIFVGVS